MRVVEGKFGTSCHISLIGLSWGAMLKLPTSQRLRLIWALSRIGGLKGCRLGTATYEADVTNAAQSGNLVPVSCSDISQSVAAVVAL
ncbi:hypothetical protein MSIMFB_04267 [Mycobacterium simulans]|uniref:Uncharacterized protein n=1 Tax=Mycobacterium simulans TaxID=627089 RepID=A0A7Z7IQ71_9MYCO|nr:hypothetical protein MSIMFB_04267 [Mycobacterium simulans]